MGLSFLSSSKQSSWISMPLPSQRTYTETTKNSFVKLHHTRGHATYFFLFLEIINLRKSTCARSICVHFVTRATTTREASLTTWQILRVRISFTLARSHGNDWWRYVVLSSRSIPTFRKHLPPPASVSKSKPNTMHSFCCLRALLTVKIEALRSSEMSESSTRLHGVTS
jgi:hypothetical protein